MEKVKIGVIGAGHLGKFHIKNLKEISNCQLVGFYDINEERAKEIEQEFDTKAFKSMDELLNNVDAVTIVVNTKYHYEVAKQCLNAGKHIFLEKPITETIEQAEELVKIAKDLGLKIQVGHIERFNPGLLSLQKYPLNPAYIQSERLAPFNPRGTDVSVVLDLMIHDIDLVLSLIKRPIVDIRASGVEIISGQIDIATARIEFDNAAVANITASRISQKRVRKMRIFQKDAYIVIDFNQGISEIISLQENQSVANPEAICYGELELNNNKKYVYFEQSPKIEVNAMKYELEAFVNAIRKEEEVVVTGEEGLRALKVANEIIEKIYQSIKRYENG
jgi:predicted dehydrogenase